MLTTLSHNPDAKLLKRVQIVLGLAQRVASAALARQVGCDRSTVYRVGARFEVLGLGGLDDGMARLRGPRVSPAFLAELGQLMDSSPREYGWERSTWSLELFGLELAKRGRVRVHPTTIARYLDAEQIAFNRARPTLVSPDPDKEAKLQAIETLWKQVHASVTRNHDAKDIEELMKRVDAFLDHCVPFPGSRPSLAKAS